MTGKNPYADIMTGKNPILIFLPANFNQKYRFRKQLPEAAAGSGNMCGNGRFFKNFAVTISGQLPVHR